MILKKPRNENYCATIVKIKNKIPLENSDNIVHTNIFGNLVIISKDTPEDDIGLFFPLETKLSKEFLSKNNLFRKPELNENKDKKGFFDENGRIRAVKLRGNKSMGFYIPLKSLNKMFPDKQIDLKEGDEFDELFDVKICEKYIANKRNRSSTNKNKNPKKEKVSKVVENQFKFHVDTNQLGKNIHVIDPEDYISITYKLHGTSVISSKVLCKRKLNVFEKVLKFIGVNINDTEYDNIYSSRKVIKNDDLNKAHEHYYDIDIWGSANNTIKNSLLDGITIYGEIVGYLENGGHIQKNYDYGCKENEHRVYVYRITYTNSSGNVFEFSHNQIKEFCRINSLTMVPELYYGKAKDLFDLDISNHWHENFIKKLSDSYLEKECYMCSNKVPAEGIVLRKESSDFKAYKYKSFSFYEHETKLLDRGENDIEEEQK